MDDIGKIVEEIETQLPFLRRYARALTGSQTRGDAYAASTLEAIITDMSLMNGDNPANVRLFRVFHSIWITQEGRPAGEAEDLSEDERIAAARLSKLTPRAREALLLKVMEQFSVSEVAQIMDLSEKEAGELVRIGAEEIESGLSARVMIVEDEPLIAMDLDAIVGSLGHDSVGNARTHGEANEMYAAHEPDLVLMDVHLADGSSGADAAADILAKEANQPIIFITAYPERLLTGQGAEPAFLITKPFTEEQVRATVSQALFFSKRQAAS
ncbi:response regulator [Roseobacter sp. HKCCA0434]|uniref:response regulator n=1 Tax=Roseobacter sp. HKCCA0434 TaxID=3079297 RepID=UPI002905BCCF|nr:response regulator [Roseobacter sp. HKCCA0434]